MATTNEITEAMAEEQRAELVRKLAEIHRLLVEAHADAWDLRNVMRFDATYARHNIEAAQATVNRAMASMTR